MKKKMLFSLLAMIAICCSCSSGGEDDPVPTPTPTPEEKPKIEISSAAPVLKQEGETVTFTFTTNADWTIDVTEGRAVSWCTVTPLSGGKGTNTLTIKTTANETYDERNAKVTIKAGTASSTFVITQKQKDVIIVAKDEYVVEAVGGDLKFDVETNVALKVETTVDWIVHNSESRGLESKSLNFTVAENTGDDAREGLIVITSGDLKQEIKVIQEKQSITFSVSQSEYLLESVGGEFELGITSVGEYTMEYWESWLQETACELVSSNRKVHTFSAEPNPETHDYEAHIYLTNKETGENIVVKVVLYGKFIDAKNEYSVIASTNQLQFDVLIDGDIKMESSVQWITCKKSQESGKKTVVVSVEKNTDGAREGRVTFRTDGNSQVVTIKQGAGNSNTGGSITGMPEHEW